MSVVINEFEVVPEPTPPPTAAEPPAPAPAPPPALVLERELAVRLARLERLRAD